MIHGLLWFPLLAVFIGLAYAGWNEYQTLETYRRWADPFQRAKYDIYSVLGQQSETLIFGKASRKGIQVIETFSLKAVESIQLQVNGQTVDIAAPPEKGKQIVLKFQLGDRAIEVPFTNVKLAAKWGEVLTKDWQELNS
ncbi:hypothetical protein [Leptolyngbya sp. GGD]|uniref:hypothetical protein n=1 Tax=Leptolyngbya sp. GGD TaxID=2997907 RepID=UPI00227A1F16|nr:hypothetical protein [Leptolyngbya sp. GGD]MCY6491670.1 hypothetical protein [Leptolyngbya sp. GGD]